VSVVSEHGECTGLADHPRTTSSSNDTAALVLASRAFICQQRDGIVEQVVVEVVVVDGIVDSLVEQVCQE
jgi:hypothetical protein